MGFREPGCLDRWLRNDNPHAKKRFDADPARVRSLARWDAGFGSPLDQRERIFNEIERERERER